MNILVIEDDAAIRLVLQDLLELNGHTVALAEDGPAGLRLAARPPDLILCDIGLPGMDGFEVIAAIRGLPACRDVPFIFLTARADRRDQRQGMALGADDYITKPFTEKDILDAIAARVRRQQPLRERVAHLLAERRAELSADWSHELMTPLNGVLGGLQLIEAETGPIDPAELRQMLGLIRAGAERQLALSRKLVAYFDLERLRTAPPAERPRCDAAATIAAGVAAAPLAAGRTADLAVRCEPGTVALAEHHFQTAVAELVGNALRLTPRGQPVSVTGTLAGGRYRLAVTDRGPGLTPGEIAQVGAFVRFPAGRYEHQGLGLGLAIARSAAESAGGRLELAPRPDGPGLRAVMDLPAV